MQYIERSISGNLITGIETMPVVFINGPRQSGKSTLAHRVATKLTNAQYVSLDDPSVYSLASTNTEGFFK